MRGAMSWKEWLASQFEISRGGRGIAPMEGLRGFAVLLVFFVHYVTQSEPWTGEWLRAPTIALHSIGSIGVDIFFLLSGYLIYGSLIRKQQPFAKFMARRVQRLYPAFLAVFAVYLCLSIAVPSQSKLPEDGAALYILENLLMLPGVFPIEPMIAVAWSLSYEMFFYLAIPLVVAVFALRRWPAYARFVLFAAIAVLLTVSDLDLKRVVMFVGGILVCEAMTMMRAPHASLAVIGVTLALASPMLPVHSYTRLAILLISCALLGWHCFAGRSLVTAVFSWTPIRWLGNMSYSYYLIHGLALKASFMALALFLEPGHDLFFALLVPMFIVTLIPSAALFLLVERPFSWRVSPAKKGRVAVALVNDQAPSTVRAASQD